MDKDLSREILSSIITYMKYARYDEKKKRRETWKEIVDRNKNMHLKRFPELKEKIGEAYELVYDKKILPSMRSMQFAGKAIENNNARIYNCSALAITDVESFREFAFLLMSGCGVGFSVQKHHIKQLPAVRKETGKSRKYRYKIGDDIEGWAEAIYELLRYYFGERKSYPDFDFGDIRPKGERLKTSGGLAPGPQPLKDCLYNIDKVFQNRANGRLTSVEIYDICCFIADCVVVGGTRRSSCICLFSFDDTLMAECKYGNWYENNPQRGRCNNSAMMLRQRITKEEFDLYFEKMKTAKSGDPGFMFSNNPDFLLNPCAEIALRVYTPNGTGQFCNLTEINATDIIDQDDLDDRARKAALIATLQSAYTDFHFIRESWKDITEMEALIGVGITGIASGRLDGLDLARAAKIVVETNESIAKEVGINPAARTTCVKPSGTTSLVLQTSSGIHSWYAPYYIRRVTLGKDELLYSYLKNNLPEILEDNILKPSTEAYICIPIKAPEEALTHESALQFLNRVKKMYTEWVLPGHKSGDNTNNVSATVHLSNDKEWDQAKEWLWKNRDSYAAISVFPKYDSTHPQLMFQEITREEYEKRYTQLKNLDLTKIIEEDDMTQLQNEAACAGGACEIV